MKINKKIKIALAAVLAACSLLNLTGCSENKREPENLTLGAEVTKTQFSPITLTDNNTVNSIRLFDAVIKDKKNAMFSPISLNMALGLIEAGADGETKAEIDSYLQTENYADFAKRYIDRTKLLTFESNDKQKSKNVLELANSFWSDNTLPIKDEYKQRVSDKFSAEIKNLDFADKESTIKEINGWVNEKTHKMIPAILDDYDTDLTAVLINTVYFESAWCDEWTVHDNEKESFTLPDGTSKELPLMYNGGDSYFENDYATAFSCNYKNGLKFIGILPKDSGEFTLESLDIPALLTSETFDYDVSAVMPRLSFESAFPLKGALKAAGLESIFDSEKANLSGISDEPLFLSDILQKTCLELDEKKTRAAAVTWGVLNAAAPAPRERRTVRLDRSFAFLIYDPVEEQILFVGKVTNP